MRMSACLIAIPTALLAACGSSVSVTTTGAASPSISVASTTSPIDPTVTELRDLAFAYWDAFNAWNADLVGSYLEETYRATRRGPITAEIDQLSAFGVQLGVQEESAPVMIGDRAAEMYMELRNPLGIRRIRMEFEMIDGDWVITFAEETG